MCLNLTFHAHWSYSNWITHQLYMCRQEARDESDLYSWSTWSDRDLGGSHFKACVVVFHKHDVVFRGPSTNIRVLPDKQDDLRRLDSNRPNYCVEEQAKPIQIETEPWIKWRWWLVMMKGGMCQCSYPEFGSWDAAARPDQWDDGTAFPYCWVNFLS